MRSEESGVHNVVHVGRSSCVTTTAVIVTASPISPTPRCGKEHQHTASAHQLSPKSFNPILQMTRPLCPRSALLCRCSVLCTTLGYVSLACVRSVLLFCAVRSLTSFSSMVWYGRAALLLMVDKLMMMMMISDATQCLILGMQSCSAPFRSV